MQHEDVTDSLLLEMELMMFMQNGEGSVIQPLMAISEAWHKQTAMPNGSQAMLAERSSVEGCDGPVLLQGQSSKVIAQGPEAERLRQELIQEELLSEDGQKWLQLQSMVGRAREVDAHQCSSPPHAPGEVIRDIQLLVQSPGLLLRFHALKPSNRIQAKDGSGVVPWKMVIGHRKPKASVLFQHLKAFATVRSRN